MLGKRFFAATPGGVLLDQPWISEPAKTVGQVLEEAGATVSRFTRIAVGA
jgi:translation elongation factor EF-Ts